MQLHQGGQALAEVTGLERRSPDPPAGPDLLWFDVRPMTRINARMSTELVDETGAIRIEVLEYDPKTGTVIALGIVTSGS
jgi:hypothetical protein